MEHSYIEENQIADRYLSGKLPAEERSRFEEHFVDCSQCLDRLETTADLRTGLRTVAAEEALRARTQLQIAQVGLVARLVRLSRARQAGLLAALLFLIAVPPVLLYREWSRASHDLAQINQVFSERQRQSEERERAAVSQMKELQAREQESAAARDQLAAQLERERGAQSRPGEKVDPAEDLQATVPVFALNVVRSAASDQSQPVDRITIPSSSKSVILLLELDPDPDLLSYRGTLSTAEGRSLWSNQDLKPGSRGTLALNFNSSLFKPGNYLLALEGVTAQRRYVPVAKYTFRVNR
ncbi:MAG TPA: hypothetical protein VJ302_31500 [Blastocatellia bacterium]|nr:hypothetical protein [Blastocatellia bacterium]